MKLLTVFSNCDKSIFFTSNAWTEGSKSSIKKIKQQESNYNIKGERKYDS